jgi:hypothetical protein
MRHLRRWGAVYILLALFIGSFLGQAAIAIPTEGTDAFWAEVLANHQSEWLQLVFQAVLLLGAKHWLFRVEAEDMERIEKKIDQLLGKVMKDGKE